MEAAVRKRSVFFILIYSVCLSCWLKKRTDSSTLYRLFIKERMNDE